MKLADFDYPLPPDRIAQRPSAPRDRSRLLVLDRRSGRMEHRRFLDLPEYLKAAEALVINDTRVWPARLIGRKESGGRVEILLLRRKAAADEEGFEEWKCLAKGRGRGRSPVPVHLPGGWQGKIGGREPDGFFPFRFAGDLGRISRSIGQPPLPPYIHRNGRADAEDRERYQTVYAREEGAVAAPTAGLHFTERLLQEIRGRGVHVLSLTLHVGPGTFLPVKAEKVESHFLPPESFHLPRATARTIGAVRTAGKRVVAVGTTVARALESSLDGEGILQAGRGETGLFILPGFRFRVVDALITNFHLPRSTLLMLVSAFAGRERIFAAYQEAIEKGYRFYSYGDAMLIL